MEGDCIGKLPSVLPFVPAEGRSSLGTSEGNQQEPVSFSCVTVSQAKCSIPFFFFVIIVYIFSSLSRRMKSAMDCFSRFAAAKKYVNIDLDCS